MRTKFEIEYKTIYGEDLFLNILEPDGSLRPLPMRTTDGIIWSIELEVTNTINYYYSVHWQGREKRSEWVFMPHCIVWTGERETRRNIRDVWMDIPDNFRITGTLIPVFSLRSHHSFGVGDFGDLRLMIDWTRSTGQKLLQILPINDTISSHTWDDSYPYSCISVFALHPQYIDLSILPPLAKEKDRERFETLREELNSLPQIDYEKATNSKLEYLHLLYAQDGKEKLASAAFKQFFNENERWLVPYAQYSYLRDTYGTSDFSKWPDHKQWDEADRKLLTTPRNKAFKDVAFWYYTQYLLYSQLKAVHTYAMQRGVILKGDIPIGVARNGCDVWQEPRYFNLNGQAGAPPDDFSEDGQNWGFPTYNWDEMLRDGCEWWERRFRNMAKFFDAYRIDHVLGFFRIWEIPIPVKSGLLGQFSPAIALSRDEIMQYGINEETLKRTTAPIIQKENTTVDWLFLRDHKNPEMYHLRIMAQKANLFATLSEHEQNAFNQLYNDYFFHRNNQFWYEEAMQKLPKLVQATRMLCCAEDLGMVPECVGWVMNDLHMLSLELESMPKTPWLRFGQIENNPMLSVATISSHDTPTLRMWWDENEERTQDYYNNILHREGTAPHPIPGWLAQEIIQRHLNCPSMLCIISLQDWLAINEKLRLADADAERINIPANPHHYWRYRMHLCIEDLIGNKPFTESINGMIIQGRRNY